MLDVGVEQPNANWAKRGRTGVEAGGGRVARAAGGNSLLRTD